MKHPKPKDNIFASAMDDVPKFRFDDTVADVFSDMIQRSVPGYSTILHMIGQITARFAQPKSHCYDLGCSLGASLLAMSEGVGDRPVNLVGIDNSRAMLARCKELVERVASDRSIELIEGDICQTKFEPMSVCVLNFTLQFVPQDQRASLLQDISNAMLPGGVLILSEKLDFGGEKHNDLMIDLHHDFKRANGYSDLEIAQKRDAIENVLVPETFEVHQKRLLSAGFSSANLWFQCFNFSSLIAFK